MAGNSSPASPVPVAAAGNSTADNQQPWINCASPVKSDEDMVSFWGLDLSPL